MALGAIIGGIAGAAGGSQQDVATQQTQLGAATAVGRQTGQMLRRQLKGFEDLIDLGPGGEDVTSGLEAQKGLAELLLQFQQGGFRPSQQDISSAQEQAMNLFAGERAGLRNIFRGQEMASNRQASRLGRSSADPILQAQLRGQQAMQESELLGRQSSLAQQLASQMPLQRLGFAQQRASVLQGLQQQALANRQSLLSTGTQIRGVEAGIQAGNSTTTSTSGGGLKGALTGALGGAGAGMGVQRGIGALQTQSLLNKALGG